MSIELTKEGERWYAHFPFSYETKDIVKAAGFRFDPARKLWWTADSAIAAKVADGASAAAKRINEEILAKRERDVASISASHAAQSEIIIPVGAGAKARGWDFFGYQRAGVEYALPRPGTLIGDEMGLGKTIQGIGVVNFDRTIKRVLIIAKASLKLNWMDELKMWLARPDLTFGVANGTFPDTDIVVVNYDILPKHRAAIDAVQWDLLLGDEIHMAKNPKAIRTGMIFGRWNKETRQYDPAPIKATRRIFLTGTPFVNRPKELWTLCKSLDPQGLGKNWKDFHERYCAAYQDKHGWHIDGASNLDELQARLRAAFMIRRLKADVLAELPPKRRQALVLQPSPAAKAVIERENRITKGHEEKLAGLRAAVQALRDDPDANQEAFKRAAEALNDAEKVAFEETSLVRHEVALAKVPQVVEHIRDLLEEGEADKLVVMAHHHDVIDAISAELGDFGVSHADGRDHIDDRWAAVKRFQNDASNRVIVCGMASMAEGHTLTASSTVVFAESDWVPGRLSQAEDRCHRIGQHDSVLVQHILLDGSMDARMTQVTIEKQEVLDRALNAGKAEALPEVKLVKAVEPPKAPAPVAPAPVGNGQDKVRITGIVSGKPASDGEAMTDVQIHAAHQAMQMLAGVCDGAFALDGAGFNRLDTAFGHDLANAPRLTLKQARYAKKLAIKYQRQLPAVLLATIKGEAADNGAAKPMEVRT